MSNLPNDLMQSTEAEWHARALALNVMEDIGLPMDPFAAALASTCIQAAWGIAYSAPELVQMLCHDAMQHDAEAADEWRDDVAQLIQRVKVIH